MMLLTLLLLSSVHSAQPAPPPQVARDIVVIGRKLQRWQSKYFVRGRQLGCQTRKSTGDAEIDAIGCAAFETCVTRLRPQIDESDRPDLDKSSRKRMKVLLKQRLSACVKEQREQLIGELAERRWMARR